MGGLDGFWADGDGEREERIGRAVLKALGLDDPKVLTVRYCESCLKEYGVLGQCLHSDDPTWSEMAVVPLAALTPPETSSP